MSFNQPFASYFEHWAPDDLVLNYNVDSDAVATDDGQEIQSELPFNGNPARWMMDTTDTFDYYPGAHGASIFNLDHVGGSVEGPESQVFLDTDRLDARQDYPAFSPFYETNFQQPFSPAPSPSSQASSTLASYSYGEDSDRRRSSSFSARSDLTLLDVDADFDDGSSYHGSNMQAPYIPANDASSHSPMDLEARSGESEDAPPPLLIASRPPMLSTNASRASSKSLVTGATPFAKPATDIRVHYPTESMEHTASVLASGSDTSGYVSDFNSSAGVADHTPGPASSKLPLKRSRSRPESPEADSDYHDNDGDDGDFDPHATKKRKVTAAKSSSSKKSDAAPKGKSKAASAAARKKNGTAKHRSPAREEWWWWDVSGGFYRCLYGVCGEHALDTEKPTTTAAGIYELRRHFNDVHGCQEAAGVAAKELRLDEAFAYVQDLSTSILRYEPNDVVLVAEANSMLDQLCGRPSRIDFADVPALKRFAQAHARDFRVWDCKYRVNSRELRAGKLADVDDKLRHRPWGQADVTLGDATGGDVCAGHRFGTVRKLQDHHKTHQTPSATGTKRSRRSRTSAN